jgi:hypothetical protein
MRSAIKMAEYLNDRLLHVILRDHWCYTVPKANAITENKSDDIKDSFYEEMEDVFY